MDYSVLKTVAPDGAVIDAYPPGGPADWKYDKGISLAGNFPNPAAVVFSKNFPDFRRTYDFQPNILDALIVSSRTTAVLEQLGIVNAELLKVRLLNHSRGIVKEDYAFLNLLDSEDAIDMDQSEVEMNPLDEQQISEIDHLVLNRAAINPEAKIFRCRQLLTLVLVRDDVKEAFEKAGLTGYRTFAADGWNGFDF